MSPEDTSSLAAAASFAAGLALNISGSVWSGIASTRASGWERQRLSQLSDDDISKLPVSLQPPSLKHLVGWGIDMATAFGVVVSPIIGFAVSAFTFTWRSAFVCSFSLIIGLLLFLWVYFRGNPSQYEAQKQKRGKDIILVVGSLANLVGVVYFAIQGI
ncbi:hypothetical protein [Kitasatospora atroaurantiaca]|nr:hypothetical protein [Kitasatospora atroaurantiaca]